MKIEHYIKTQITGLWSGLCISLTLYPWVNHFLSVIPSVRDECVCRTVLAQKFADQVSYSVVIACLLTL